MTKYYSIIWLFVLLLACREHKPATISNSGNTLSYRDSLTNSIAYRFNLPGTSEFKADSNTLLFAGMRTFDTSFVIQLKQNGTAVNGVYYEVNPTYHRNINDTRLNESQVLYFEGYSFILDSAKWEVVKTRVGEMLSNDTTFKEARDYMDGSVYILAYNFRSSKSSYVDDARYESLHIFLKDMFLEDLIQNRRPIMYR